MDGYSGQTETICVIPSSGRCSSESATDKLPMVGVKWSEFQVLHLIACRLITHSLAEINLVLHNDIHILRFGHHLCINYALPIARDVSLHLPFPVCDYYDFLIQRTPAQERQIQQAEPGLTEGLTTYYLQLKMIKPPSTN